MSNISSALMNDTFNLIQLARETALAAGNSLQAERFTPVVNEMRNLITRSRENRTNSSSTSKTMSVMSNSEFKSLLNAVSQSGTIGSTSTITTIGFTSAQERNQLVTAMANGGMSELDIARQMGLTRNEVKMILSVNSE